MREWRVLYPQVGTQRTWLGSEGGTEWVILQTFRCPWGFYLSVKVPPVRGRWRRFRLYFGPRMSGRFGAQFR